MKKRLWLIALTLAAVLVLLSGSVLADETEPVARIGETEYTTLDKAVLAAEEGATIEILSDCTLETGFNKTLTFTGTGKISITKQLTSNGEGWMCFGLYDPTRVLTFDGQGLEVYWASEVETAPWLMLSLSGTLNVQNGAKLTFVVDSGATGSRNAIYMNAGAEINVSNGGTLEIFGNKTTGKPGQGIQLDQTGTATISVTGNSTFLIDGTNRGYVNSPKISVTDSTLIVRNCTANASNGGVIEATNSTVQYLNNAGHGISAGTMIAKNSKIVCTNNGYYGLYCSGTFSVDSTSEVIISGNSARGDFAGLKLTSGVTNGIVEAGAVVAITDNYCSGLSNNGEVTFEEGVDLTITGNYNDKGTKSHGGGVYNSGASADLSLPSDAVIYNNHADTDGDDIFNNTTATITFGPVGANWILDDCEDLIDGWYQDGAESRWSAHDTPVYAELYTPTGEAVTRLLALKAAHGLAHTVTIHYLERETEKVLADAVTTDAYYAGTEVDLSEYLDKDIRGYRQVEVEVVTDNATIDDGKITMPSGNVVINVYYERNPILPILPGLEFPDADLPGLLNLEDHYAYIIGYDDGNVKPNNNITRAEVATIFFRLLTDDARAYYWSTDSGFSDVNEGDWYNNAVSTMVQAGILNGYSDGTFKPNANITRGEFATIAARFLSNPYSTKDRFYDTEGHWAEVYINRAAEAGWIDGYPDGTFRPDQAITRAEAVTLVNAVLGRAPHEDHLLPDMIVWPDNPKSAWYYEAIQEATNSHDYDWAASHAYEIWTELLENRQWSKLEKEWSDAYSAPGGEVMD